MTKMEEKPYATEALACATIEDVKIVNGNIDDDEDYTLKEQRKIIHKIDRRLLIVIGAMQAVSFLDRANMSNANIAG